MIQTDGVTPSAGGLEYQTAMKEIKHLRTLFGVHRKNPLSYENRRSAILFNLDNY